jgi:hypothetical protein
MYNAGDIENKASRHQKLWDIVAMAAPTDGAAVAALEGVAFAGPSAATSTSTLWALVTP